MVNSASLLSSPTWHVRLRQNELWQSDERRQRRRCCRTEQDYLRAGLVQRLDERVSCPGWKVQMDGIASGETCEPVPMTMPARGYNRPKTTPFDQPEKEKPLGKSATYRGAPL
jgi:hypothetical protein